MRIPAATRGMLWLLGAAGAAGVLGAGWLITAGGRNAEAVRTELALAPQRMGAEETANLPSPRGDQPAALAAEDGWEAILAEPSSELRLERLQEWLAHRTASEFAQWAEAFAAAADDPAHAREWELFVLSWARADGRSALEKLAGAVPAGGEKTGAGGMAGKALAVWAEAEPAAAAEFVAGLAPDPMAFDLLPALAPSMARDPAAAARWLQASSEFDFRSESVAAVAREWGRRDPARAAAWLAQFSADGENRRATGALAGVWAAADGVAAMGWARSLAEGETRDEALEAAARAWTERNAEAAGLWLKSQPDDARLEPAVLSFARVAAKTDPAAAMEWVMTLRDDQLRQIGVRAVWPRWQEMQPAEAGEWLLRAGLSPVLERELASRG